MLTFQNLPNRLNEKKVNYCENLLIETDSTNQLANFNTNNQLINCKYLNSETTSVLINTPSPSPPSLLLMKVPLHKRQSKLSLLKVEMIFINYLQ